MKKKLQIIWIAGVLTFSGLLVLHMQNVYNINNILGRRHNKRFEDVLKIPNIVHYVLFGKNYIPFITYLSILSVLKIQKPTVIYVHTDEGRLGGHYWQSILNLRENFTKTKIELSVIIQPTHVYGQKLSSVYHASDIVRIHVLRNFGGIYLDNDMLLINPLDYLRIYDCVLGWPPKQNIGTQLIMANKDSKLLQLWQEGYKKYRPWDWYYNAGVYPTELLQANKDLAHVEPERFGVQNLLEVLVSSEKWDEWRWYYGVHVLIRHNAIIRNLDEDTVWNSTTNFAAIARWILKL